MFTESTSTRTRCPSVGTGPIRGSLRLVQQPTTDILTSGSDEPRRLSRRGLIMLSVALLAVVAGFAAWRLWPTAPPTFTLADLQGVYAGMVRSDGTSDASVIDPGRSAPESGDVVPSACQPLFDATVLNKPPLGALNGVGTFWALGPSGISLFTYRFSDLASAGHEYARLTAAFDDCRGRLVEVRAQPAVASVLSGLRRDREQLAYVLTSADGPKLAVHVLIFSNTVTWQYRYEPVPGPYAPQTAQNVMDSLSDQLRAVQNLRR
jgi:hypothetical protein